MNDEREGGDRPADLEWPETSKKPKKRAPTNARGAIGKGAAVT